MNHREKVWEVVAEYLPPMDNGDLKAMVDDLTELVVSEYEQGYHEAEWLDGR